MRLLIFSFFFFIYSNVFSQTIEIVFPKFAGKTFDFIIFQGDKQVKIYENDTIPRDGIIQIQIPKEYAPYTGMSRWLITNTEEGGGLDMAIPGHGFKVFCLSDKPSLTNIVFEGFDAMHELNRISSIQQVILDKYKTINQAAQLYGTNHPLYPNFVNEIKVQQQAFEDFKKELKVNTNYNAKFLPIVNLTTGIAPILSTNESEITKSIDTYISQELNFDHLYTSGHWTGILQSWVQLHAQVFQDKEIFTSNFDAISKRITVPAKYTDFVGKITYYLSLYGKDDFITAITPTVVGSGKITSYIGKTMEVYVKALVGSQAPDLILTKTNKQGVSSMTYLEGRDFAAKDKSKTLLLFYKSGCGPCETLLSQLLIIYKKLQDQGVDIISISADEDEELFHQTAKAFPWPQSYCDFSGTNGTNFRNYAVMGTPTMYLINKFGKIEKKFSDIKELVNEYK